MQCAAMQHCCTDVETRSRDEMTAKCLPPARRRRPRRCSGVMIIRTRQHPFIHRSIPSRDNSFCLGSRFVHYLYGSDRLETFSAFEKKSASDRLASAPQLIFGTDTMAQNGAAFYESEMDPIAQADLDLALIHKRLRSSSNGVGGHSASAAPGISGTLVVFSGIQ